MVLGTLFDYLIISKTYIGMSCIAVVGAKCPLAVAGWPFKFEVWKQADYYNLPDVLFWLFTVFIVLSLIRYFKRK